MAGKSRSPEAGTQISMHFPALNKPEANSSQPLDSWTEDPEADITLMHRMNNYRPYEGGKGLGRLVEQEVDFRRRQFLKNIGAITPAERYAYLREVITPEQIAYLQHLGVWDSIESGTLGFNEIEALLPLLEGSQTYSVDPTSAVDQDTIFASPAALARYHAQGGKPPQRLKPWVEGQRAKKFPHK